MADSRPQTKGWDGMPRRFRRQNALNVVLSVSPNDEDCASLERICKSNWTVSSSSAVASALSVLRETPIPIVICDCDITPDTRWGCWTIARFFPISPLQLEHSSHGENKMEAIVLTDDELQRLETRFGPVVRQMGSWNSDGVFGYASVPIVAVEKAAETLDNPNLPVAFPRLRATEQTKAFIELLEDRGSVLAERIAAAYREFSPCPSPPAPMNSRHFR